VHRGRADHAPPLERDTRAHTVFRCRERPIYTPAGVQPATRDLLHAVMTWLGRYAHPAPRGKTVSHAKCRTCANVRRICPFSWIAEQRRRSSSRRSGAWFESPLAVSADKNAWPASSRRVAVHAVVLRRVVDRARVAVTLRSARPGRFVTPYLHTMNMLANMFMV
jgi:hypothetical protein